MIRRCRLSIRKICIATVCLCALAGIFCYSTFQNAFLNYFPHRPTSVAGNTVVSLTGFLSISQHQLNSKTNLNEKVHIILERNRKKDDMSESSIEEPSPSKEADSWDELELYTVTKPSLDKQLRRGFKNGDELDSRFLRNDEKTIERIVNGLGTDLDESLPSIFRKKGTPKKRYPNALIIGVKKAGTRALLQMLKLHPQICSCGPEIHYFDRYYTKSLEWYRNRMPLCYENEITMEKTPSYFVTSGVAKEVYEYSKHLKRKLKLIVIIRDPTKRAISDFTQTQTKEYQLKRSFDDVAIETDLDGQRHVNTQWAAIKTGVYAKHLKRWLRYFELHRQILVVSGENLTKQPYEELKKVEKFLNLPSFIQRKHFVYNATKGFYCFDKQISEPYKSPNITNLQCLSSSKGRPHVFVANETEKLLRDYFRPFNEELYTLLGQNFGWP